MCARPKLAVAVLRVGWLVGLVGWLGWLVGWVGWLVVVGCCSRRPDSRTPFLSAVQSVDPTEVKPSCWVAEEAVAVVRLMIMFNFDFHL